MSWVQTCILNFNIKSPHRCYILESLDFNEALCGISTICTFCWPAPPLEGADTGVQHPRPVNGSGMDQKIWNHEERQQLTTCSWKYHKPSKKMNEKLHRFSQRFSIIKVLPIGSLQELSGRGQRAFPGQKKVIARPTWMTRFRIQIINNYQQLSTTYIFPFLDICILWHLWILKVHNITWNRATQHSVLHLPMSTFPARPVRPIRWT